MVKRRHKPISDSEIDYPQPSPPQRKGGITTSLTVEQMAGQMIGGLAPEHRMPSRPQATEIEIAQVRDLVLQFAH
jgi:hypothetical protein